MGFESKEFDLKRFGVTTGTMAWADPICEIVDVEKYADQIKEATVFMNDNKVTGILFTIGTLITSLDMQLLIGSYSEATEYWEIPVQGQLVGFKGLQTEAGDIVQLQLVEQRNSLTTATMNTYVQY